MIRVLYHAARADFLERVRRYSFLLTMIFAVGLAYGAYSGTVTLQLDNYRGVYNSAWTGCMMTLVSSVFITLAGFYIVKNTIQRDEQTRVGLVLATTPMSRSLYVLSKAASNFAVMALMVAVLAVGAVVLQLARAERTMDLAQLLAPFAWVALPAVAVTAATAVLFETLPVLRGGAGNVIYFFAWAFYIGFSGVNGVDDFTGLGFLSKRMTGALKSIDPAYRGGFSLQVGPTVSATKKFLWNGVDWTVWVVLGRLKWIAIAIAIAWLSALFFHRFDPARERRRHSPDARQPDQAPVPAMAPVAVELTPLPRVPGGGQFPRLVAAELRLMLKGRAWWWYVVAMGLLAAGLAVPNAQARQLIGGFAWLWPILIWSQMGARESRHSTERLLFSCAHVLDRQLPAVWLAGVAVAIATGGAIGIRAVIAGDWTGFTAWLAGALFIPSFALALGVWSGSSKPFEAFYTLLWYVGPMNHAPGLDFLVTPGYALPAAILLMAAYLGRRRKLGYA
jgi:hypothetical protein